MTPLSPSERIQLAYQERVIKAAWYSQIGALMVIDSNSLYREKYPTFDDYLMFELVNLGVRDKGVKPSTYRQWKSSYQANLIAQEHDVVLANEHAARALKSLDDKVKELVIVGAQTHASATGSELVRATDIRASAEELGKIVGEAAITGHIDLGDGTSTPIAAALETHLVERIKRSTQHAIDGAKRAGWSEPRIFSDGYHIDHFFCTEVVPQNGQEIEIKWRLVKVEPEVIV